MISLEQVKIGQKSIMLMVDQAISLLPAEMAEDKEHVMGVMGCLGDVWKDYMSTLTKYAQKNVNKPDTPEPSMKFLKITMQKRDEGLRECFGVLSGGDELCEIYLKKFVRVTHPITLQSPLSDTKTKQRVEEIIEKKQSKDNPNPVREKKKWWQRN